VEHHVPELGDLLLLEVRARHVVDLFHKLRADRERNLVLDGLAFDRVPIMRDAYEPLEPDVADHRLWRVRSASSSLPMIDSRAAVTLQRSTARLGSPPARCRDFPRTMSAPRSSGVQYDTMSISWCWKITAVRF
jgi:hypothetical protein